MDLFRYPQNLGVLSEKNVVKICKNDPQNRPFRANLTYKLQILAEGQRFLEKMVSNTVFLSDFEHNIAYKGQHIHINFFIFPKSGPFVRKRGGTGTPRIPPSLRPWVHGDPLRCLAIP